MKLQVLDTSGGPVTPQAASARIKKDDPHRTLWGDAWLRMRRNRAAVISAVFLLFLIGAALAAPLLTPYSPEDPDFGVTLQRPDATHLLGTDELGRDMIARLLFGARVSLAVGLVVQIIALGVGSLLGLCAGYFGGTVDLLVMRMVDIMYAFPSFLFAVFMVAFLDPSIGSIVLVLSLTGWPFAARLVRGQVLALRDLEYVAAARAVGAGSWRIMLRHILPNTLGILVVYFTLGIADVIMAEAGLSFLGIGIRPPTPSWGGMIAKSREYFRAYPYLALYPSIALALTVLAFNFLGDGLRDALDPRMRK